MELQKLIIFIASCSFSFIHTQHLLHDPAFQHAMKTQERIHNLENKLDVLKSVELLKNMLPEVMVNHSKDIFDNTDVCERKLLGLISTPAGHFYIDALGKPGAGVFSGNLGWYGSYDECISVPDSLYCSIRNIVLNGSLPLSIYGVCVPNVCTVDGVINVLNKSANYINSKLNYPLLSVVESKQDFFHPLPSKCLNMKESRNYTSGAIVMIVISSILLFLCFCGTVAEYLINFRVYETPYTQHVDTDDGGKQTNNYVIADHNPKPFYLRFLLCFSITKNTKSVLSTKSPAGSIECINGIRTISIFWVILGHTIILTMSGSDNIGLLLTKWVKRFTMQGILNAPVSVDTFFVLSGLLVGYLSFKRFESHGKLPLVRFYVHRYIRLTVPYAYLIFFVTYLLPYLNHGPNWNDEPDKGCRDYWWTNLLYINNFIPSDFTGGGCYPVSWYLANDMQFYVISPIILWCMYKWKTIGVIASSSLLLLEYLLSNGLLIHLKNGYPLMITNGPFMQDPRTLNYQKYIYQKPYARIAPYVIGLVLGYILFYKKTMVNVKSKAMLYMCGWIVAAGIALAVVYGPYTAVGRDWDYAELMTYGLFFRIAWALVIAYVIYACHNGYGSLVNNFLSWGAFLPLSRLTYGTYLIHWYVLAFFFGGLQTPFHVTEITISFLFISVTVISYILSFIVAIVIEYPVGNLERLLFKF